MYLKNQYLDLSKNTLTFILWPEYSYSMIGMKGIRRSLISRIPATRSLQLPQRFYSKLSPEGFCIVKDFGSKIANLQ